MKTLILILLSFTALAQKVEVGKNSYMALIVDDKKVSEGFKLLRKLRPLKTIWYDLYVIKDGKTYYKPGINLFPKRTYLITKV